MPQDTRKFMNGVTSTHNPLIAECWFDVSELTPNLQSPLLTGPARRAPTIAEGLIGARRIEKDKPGNSSGESPRSPERVSHSRQ